MKHMNQTRNNLESEIMLYLLNGEAHGREISKKLALPPTSVHRALIGLEKMNAVNFRISGKNKVYSIKKNLVTKKHIFDAENYKFVKLIDKYPFLEPLFKDIIKACGSPMIILFGSFAKFAAKRDSDIDIFIETTNKKVKKRVESINSRLSVKIGNFKKNSLLVKEIIKNHVIIKGVERFYDQLGLFE